MDKTLKNELIKYATRELVRKGLQDVVDSTTPSVTIINPKSSDDKIRYNVIWKASNGNTVSVECIIKSPFSMNFMDMGTFYTEGTKRKSF